MVQELPRQRQSATFPESAPAANPVFFRTYSRRTAAGLRESYDQVCDSEALRRNRTLKGLVEIGKTLKTEPFLLDKIQQLKEENQNLKEENQELKEKNRELKEENHDLKDQIESYECEPYPYSLDGAARCNISKYDDY